jgi:N4-gp56 family major capsid protein
MAALTRAGLNANVLQTWLYRKVLENFEPNLQFFKMGEQPLYQDGYNTVSWAKFSRLTVTAATATLTDGLTPSETAFNATVISTTPVQYGIFVNISDMVIDNNVIDFIGGAATEVGTNMARIMDNVIQTEVMAGTNVQFADASANRAALTVTDILIAKELNLASTTLDANFAPTFDGGMFVGIAHPNVIYDLRAETNTGAWLDANKYVVPEKIFRGEIGALNKVRIVMSANVQTFASTTTVYPTLVLGRGAYGVSQSHTLQSFITPRVASDSDPLAQRQKVGAKMAFSAKRLQEQSMVRIESGYSLT